MRKTFKILMLQQRLLLREGEAPAEPGLESDLMRNSRLGPNLATSPPRPLAGSPSSAYVCTDATVDVFRCYRTGHLVFRMAGVAQTYVLDVWIYERLNCSMPAPRPSCEPRR